VVVLAPVTPETIGMVDAAFLARMKDGALLVNAARGSLVVTGALAAELRRGRLRAVLDVTDPEPIRRGDPLLRLDNVVITPHIGSASHATREKMGALAVGNILAVFSGRKPPLCANPAVRMRPQVAHPD